ncbi:M1 family metallopeptidase [Lactococcus fujiensis]|uniref:Aminopeptidase n=1 Tax=Lactococcus fujiensis JCM 16395 TaxID=1291764 RepID=A0A2A5RMV5_9LACT|nr:M1 family metallopeptidase [Lactococcus fujiensis]PCS00654.1 aminopeptidase N [Lactococcus fujiensis JCM 16395]
MAVKHLIDTFVPENYKIFLDIDRKSKTFKGQVAIKGEAKSENVYFHAKDLHIHKVRVFSVDTNFMNDYENEEVVVGVGTTGPVTISFEYEGEITDNMMGIYPSYYEVDGEKKMLIGTQFESHFARQAFPSIDEPEAKATFDLSIKFDEEAGDTIISNMPELLNIEGIHVFERTVKMSSYLLAFVFGDMQYKTAKTRSGVTVGTFSTKAHKPEALDFPLEIATKCIEFYEEYFKTPYPLAHSWNVALPDFSAGAMENWGCITYREVCMLVDPDNATAASKQYVASVICHELAHQWFGDLVTMKWWDDLWLNESFANMMEYVASDALHPEWDIWNHFSIVEANLALNRDATDGVQSVHVEVTHPDEINTLFDPAIVYAKGARLMVMLRKWLGDEDFSNGLHNYFEAHKYGNTVGNDLWIALSETSGKDVAGLMNSWLDQPGYPVVDVRVEGDELVLSQKQFFIGEGEEIGRLWQVPLNSSWNGLPDVLGEREVRIPGYAALKEANSGIALRLNDQNAAHYLVNYEDELLTDLLATLSGLDEITKFQILQDRKSLAKGQVISYADVVTLLPYFTGEKSYIVSQALSQIISDLELFIDENSEVEKAFHKTVDQLFAADYQRLGWEKVAGESSDDETQRGLVLNKMILADNDAAKTKASEIFASHSNAFQTIPADIRPIVLSNEIKTTDSADLVKQFVDTYVKSSVAEFKDELSTAVANAKNPAITEQLLASMKDGEIVKPQDISKWYFRILSKDFSQDMAWAWAKENWEWVKEKLGGDMSFDKFVIYPANVFKTAGALAEYKAFFEPKLDILGLGRSIKMGIKQIEARVNLIENQKGDVVSSIKEVAEKL